MLTLYDEFAGVGGSSWGASRVPGVQVILAANHWDVAVDSHAANFPDTEHYCGDVRAIDMAKFPRADIFWASPACPPWTDSRGKRRDFDLQTIQQPTLFGDAPQPDPATRRARALMEEVPRYLSAMALRGQPVLAGVVENVVQCRLWHDWDRWISEITTLGYHTRLIAFNSMHAAPSRSPRAPQSRDRLYLAYWHRSLGRNPDWDKWLRPTAWCTACDKQVQAVQVWKRPGQDMGRYRAQYVYQCPNRCGQMVEPETLPALAAIDPTLPAVALGDREEPLAAATMDRIRAGVRRYWLPLLVPAGGTWRDQAVSLAQPMPTRTTRETDPASQPLGTVSAQGNHHGLAMPPPLMMRNLTARGDQGQMCTPATEPARTVTASNRQSLLTWEDQELSGLDVEEILPRVRFRMLEPEEIGAAMAFPGDYKLVARAKRDKVRLYGNAVTPPVAELIVSALVEAITGEELPR